MPSIERPSRLRRGRAIALAMAAGLGMTASASQAAPEDGVAAAVRAEASHASLRGCGVAPAGGARFVVDTTQGGKRTITLCAGGEGGDLAATARALSLAIDAAPAAPAIASDPRTLDLLSLRTIRARAEVDMSMSPDGRSERLGRIDREIKALEAEISSPAKAH